VVSVVEDLGGPVKPLLRRIIASTVFALRGPVTQPLIRHIRKLRPREEQGLIQAFTVRSGLEKLRYPNTQVRVLSTRKVKENNQHQVWGSGYSQEESQA